MAVDFAMDIGCLATIRSSNGAHFESRGIRAGYVPDESLDSLVKQKI
jgi:hypothetical protein